MSGKREVRASDGERQAAADQLRAAHDEGRLDLYEYDRRLQLAYQAVTNGDLDRLFADLPAAGLLRVARASQGRRSVVQQASRSATAQGFFAGLPTVLKILWINWVAVVAINLTVWTLVNLGEGEADYFWPMWLAVPGVVLLGVSAGVHALRTHGRAAIER